ncbi:effector-associated constant component EACC1 [Nocardia sp. CA-129566]|uniref:effector-associated constant component EACC1 n=1 Tax=Nocardia sp. CA-129566 TaxID=3239976 RepID=UPI003D98B1F9
MSNPQGQLSIRTSGSPDDLLQLLDWFRHDDALRGRVVPRAPQIHEGQLGEIYEVLQVALGSGGLATALAVSLRTWLINRRSNIKISLTRDSDGVTVEVDAQRADPDELIDKITKLINPSNPIP